MIEILVTLVFLFMLIAMGRQWDNPEAPSKPKPPKPEPFETSHIGPTKKAYMASDQWNMKRKATLKRDNYSCQCCGISEVPLEVHHITYRNYLAEKPEDLVSLCRGCHQLVHDIHGYDYSNTFPIDIIRA